MICCLVVIVMVMVVVLVKLVVEAGQVLMQVYWYTPLYHLLYIEVCPPDPSTSSYPIHYSYWVRISHPQTICLPLNAFCLTIFSLLPALALH